MFSSRIVLQTYKTLSDKPEMHDGVCVAGMQDIGKILELIKEFRKKAFVKELQEEAPAINEQLIRSVLCKSINSGICLVFRNKQDVQGYLFANIVESLWAVDQSGLEEIGFYPRTPKIGLMLLKKYIDKAIELKQRGIIQYYTMASLSNFDYDYSKFGFTMLERKWIA